MPAPPYVALLVAAALIYVPALFAARERLRMPEGFDNAHPRAQQARLTMGIGQRALGCHANGWEAFAPFAAAVLACEQRHVADARIAGGCAAFVLSRIFYTAFYLGNLPPARSAVWFLGATAIVALFVFAIAA
jgi:uncharacterized MAPEG superfamily protein